MSGHSKWANIKHRKMAQDAKRAAIFAKLAKNITLAAKNGGNPETNFALRLAIEKAKQANVSKENIERAIKRGTGELRDSAAIEEIVYEAYGPGQVAMLIKVATDNRNRTLSEIKNILNKNGGKFVEGGGVNWQFEPVGMFCISQEETKKLKDQDELELKLIEFGAKDLLWKENDLYVFTTPSELKNIQEKTEKEGIKTKDAELIFWAKNTIKIDEKSRKEYEKLLEFLDDQDDVVEIYDNLE